MITRKEYMDGTFTHEEYYSHFVNDEVKRFVTRSIGLHKIKSSTDPHFNDIPLYEWDRLNSYLCSICDKAISKANSSVGVSLSDCVCINKQAARMIKESNTDKD